ncbi:hypothetical protein NX059_004681 [Plenodomus lindquistii]|nr:hypothetical protein NX059_004681 [Plenodomus lindquistii]
MDHEEDMEIAAAMGFGSFGGTKKRKYDHTKSPRATADDASGANSTQLGVRTKKSTSAQEALTAGSEDSAPQGQATVASSELSANVSSAPVDQSRNNPSAMETVSFGGTPITRGELNALKFGVKNSNGDTAYFLPDFVEDPWAKLAKSGT